MLSAVVLIQNLRWLVPTTLMLGAAPAYISIWGVWRAITAFLPRWLYVKGDDWMFSTYHRNLLFYFETLTGAELLFYGDLSAVQQLPGGENCLYLSNHQTTMDWVIATCLAIRRGSLGRVRYVLKDGLKFLPFYGVYLGLHGSVFVKRAGKFRKDQTEAQLHQDAQDKKPMWLVIFPEGTRYNPELVNITEGSKQFADQQGLQALECVLFPRVRAFEVCVQQLKDSVACVYDVTIAYESAFDFKKRQRLPAPSMQDFLMGWCRRVHIHVARIPVQEVPSDAEQLKLWLYARFQLKDRLLQEFHSATRPEEARFPGPFVVKPLALSALVPSVLLWSGTFALCNSCALYRGIYWKLGLGTALVGLMWSGLRY